jgi:hypothetical protein
MDICKMGRREWVNVKIYLSKLNLICKILFIWFNMLKYRHISSYILFTLLWLLLIILNLIDSHDYQ